MTKLGGSIRHVVFLTGMLAVAIVDDGETVGAIGVAGGSSPQDAQVAQAGIDALAKILR